MIKINLVPVKEKKKRKEFLMIFGVAIFFVVVALVMGWFYIQRLKVKSRLNKEIAQIEEESKGYQDKITEMKDLEAKEDSLKGFKQTIGKISETQRVVLAAFDQLALAMPAGVWLTNVTQGKGADSDKFVVGGYAFSDSNLRAFLEAIKRPGSLLQEMNTEIKSISAAVKGNQKIEQFEIKAKVTGASS